MRNLAPTSFVAASLLEEISPSDYLVLFMGGGKFNEDSIVSFVDNDGYIKAVKSIRTTKDGPDKWVKVRI